MEIEEYFEDLKSKVNECYRVAGEARGKGLDPVSKVECPLALTMAEKAVNLVRAVYPKLNVKRVEGRILELEEEFGKLDNGVVFSIAREITEGKFGNFGGILENIDCGLRVGFAYMTLGVVVTPIEGFTGLKVLRRNNSKQNRGSSAATFRVESKDLVSENTRKEYYFSVNFSGPVRSAGTTTISVFLILVDYLREVFGFGKYDASDEEVERYVLEISEYHNKVTNLAYFPSEDEIRFLAKGLPVQINGEPTERLEVSGFRDLGRVSTNRIRGGMCLAFGEGLALKAGKGLGRTVKLKEKGMVGSGWDYLEDYLVLHKKRESGSKEIEATYIKDIVAGRPVFGHPGRSGTFRLRYGRARTSGFSSVVVHPASMAVSGGFLSHGVQFRFEKLIKAGITTSCDSIEPPIVRLRGGSIKRLSDYEEARRLYSSGEIEEVVYFGDILFSIGDVVDRNADLLKVGYVEEWWRAELKKVEYSTQNHAVCDRAFRVEDFEELIKISDKYRVALHPLLIFYWSQINNEEFFALVRWLNGAEVRGDKLILNWESANREKFGEAKRALEKLGVLHEVVMDNIVVSEDMRALLLNLGKRDFYNGEKLKFRVDETDSRSVLDIVNEWCEFKVKDKAGTFIGSRMGRPEKAKLRKLTGSPNSLFPVGTSGGRMKNVKEAVESGFVKSRFANYVCESCGVTGIFEWCECGAVRKRSKFCRGCGEVKDECKFHDDLVNSWSQKVDVRKYFDAAVEKVGIEGSEEMKGVAVLDNEGAVCERLEKGILRSRMGLSVNKDGTIRYDVIEIALTHFKAKEIGVSVEKLRKLGYDKDILGDDLVSDSQVLELKPHDVILPASRESRIPDKIGGLSAPAISSGHLVSGKKGEEDAGEVFTRIANFVDEELELFYGMEKFYDLKSRDDLIGKEVVCMAPHNVSGVVGRVIGWTSMQGILASPFMHAAMRRDCDGDECSVMLLMDVLLNFSVKFLPSHRGGRQDAPLVLNARIDAGEVDDQVLFLDIMNKYPLELYEAAEKGEHSSVVRDKLDFIGDRLKSGEEVLLGNSFTHDTGDINFGNNCSAYKTLPTMKEKVWAQMDLVSKLRGVDEDDVARLILERHFIRDIRGNLRKFCRQQFRCSSCNEKYRRPPLTGSCWKCGGKLIFTVSEGSVRKYLDAANELVDKYKVSGYMRENMELIGDFVERIFGREEQRTL